MTDSTAYFESVAPSWSDLRRDLFPDDLRDRALDAVSLEPGRRAADLGAGTGFLTEGLLERGLQVVAVDRSAAMLAELERRLGPRDGLEVREGSAEALPVADGEVDFVFANMFLHHVEDPAATLREVARILAPGGRLVLTDLDSHDHEFLRTEQHDRWLGFDRTDVAAWLDAAGFQEVEVRDTSDTCCSPSCSGGERAEVSIFLAKATKPAVGKAAPGTAQGSGADGGDSEEALREEVRRRYARAAREADSGGGCGCGCGTEAEGKSPELRALGDNGRYGARHYASDAAELPATALEASLGCANPVALADLQPGEAVLDLGSGGGIDVILSARRVGSEGRVYGLDMTDEMLDLARRNVEEAGLENVELLRGLIEEIPLPGGSVDVVLSNCVINLSSDKGRVLAEAFRVLRPGGRLAVADVVATRPMPDELRRRAELWSACVAGALTVEDYRSALLAAGFEDVEVVTVGDPSERGGGDPGDSDPEELRGLIASAHVRARKPATCC